MEQRVNWILTKANILHYFLIRSAAIILYAPPPPSITQEKEQNLADRSLPAVLGQPRQGSVASTQVRGQVLHPGTGLRHHQVTRGYHGTAAGEVRDLDKFYKFTICLDSSPTLHACSIFIVP